jgi:hypothetical protein
VRRASLTAHPGTDMNRDQRRFAAFYIYGIALVLVLRAFA